jgi:hypothetical protein
MTLTPIQGDPCPHRGCGTHVQGRPDAPRDREAGLLLHLRVVHYPDRSVDEIAARLHELYAVHEIRWGGDSTT